MTNKTIIMAIAISVFSQAGFAKTDNSKNNAQLTQFNAANAAIEIRRHIRLRKFKLAEFTTVLRQRAHSTYKLFRELPQEQQRVVLEAFNSGKNVAQLKSLIKTL